MDNLIDTNDRQNVLNEITAEYTTPVIEEDDDNRFDWQW